MTLEQLKDEAVKEFDKQFLPFLLPLLPNIPNKNIPYDLKQFLLSQLEYSYTQGVNDTVEKVEKIINGAENLFKESHEFVEADAREMCQICGKDKDDHEDYLFGNIRQQLETLRGDK